MKRRWVIAGVVVLVLVGLVLGANYAAEQVARAKIDAYFKTLPPGVQVSYSRVRLGFLDMSAHVEDVNFRTGVLPPLHCDEFIIRRMRMENGEPVDLDISTRGMLIPPELFAALGGDRSPILGDREWVLDSDCDYTLDTVRKTLAVKTLSVSIRDLVRMDLGVVLQGVDYDRLLAQDPEAAKELRLAEGHVSLADQGLVDVIVNAVAARKGLPADKVRAILRRRIEQEAGRVGASSPGSSLERLRAEAIAAARDVILHHSGMVLTCKPKSPVGIEDVLGLPQETVLDRLNLHVTSR